MPVSRKPQVDQDLLGIADYISRDSLAAAIRFLDAAEATFDWLAESPDVGIRCDFAHPELFDIRWWKVKGFDRHLIFYRIVAGGVEVLRVMHSSRDYFRILKEQLPP